MSDTKVGDRIIQGKEIVQPSLPSSPSLGVMFAVVSNVLAQDQVIADAWLRLYNTVAGRDYAEFIYENMVLMQWWANPFSQTICDDEGSSCILYLDSELMPANLEFDPSPDLAVETQKSNELAATMGHEGYHATVYSAHLGDSQFEEAMGWFVDDAVYSELTGGQRGYYEDLFVSIKGSLNSWIKHYHPLYEHYDSYPGHP